MLKLLIVDDEAPARARLRRMLDQAGGVEPFENTPELLGGVDQMGNHN